MTSHWEGTVLGTDGCVEGASTLDAFVCCLLQAVGESQIRTSENNNNKHLTI